MADDQKTESSSITVIDDLLAKFNTITLQKPRNTSCKTALFYHKDCLKHYPINSKGVMESHVERPERCSISYSMLKDFGLLKHLIQITAREATDNELSLTHTNKHIKTILNNNKKHGNYDGDTFYNSNSPRAAKLAAGATIDLMTNILTGKIDNGFALVRPPGHHCEKNKPMGFCLFNNAVVAVNCVRKQGLCQKILIVDWDVHHGNGTENMFYDDNNVLYFSTHRHDNGFFYPETGKK
eukprot:347180_1